MGNWLNIVIILIAIGGPVLGAVWKRLEIAREKRRIEQEIQRRRDEALRTGQAIQPLSSPVQAPEPPRDPAAAQRARLEELRRRQQERLRQAAAGGGQVRATPTTPGQFMPPRTTGPGASPMPAGRGGTPVARPPTPQRLPSSRPVPTQRTTAQQTSPQRTSPQRTTPQRTTPQRGAAPRTPQQRVATQRPSAPRPTSRQQASSGGDREQVLGGLVRALEEDESRATTARTAIVSGEIGEMGERGASRAGGRRNRAMARAFGSSRPTRADLRRAVVLREVLDAPVALRTGASSGGPF